MKYQQDALQPRKPYWKDKRDFNLVYADSGIRYASASNRPGSNYDAGRLDKFISNAAKA